jgi:hypothetical protein
VGDVVVTVPKNFRYGTAPAGLAAWLYEGDAPGERYSGELWDFTTFGPKPTITKGERVYVVCNGRVVGFAPLVELMAERRGQFWWLNFVRAGGAVACTIPEQVIGFRGWRYRWWDRSVEVPLDLSAYLPDGPNGWRAAENGPKERTKKAVVELKLELFGDQTSETTRREEE